MKNTYKLLEAGATIPFISRYRKEVTGGLDEVMIQSIFKRKGELEDIVKRKATILVSIGETGKLTGDLKNKIDECWSAQELEDIYMPFKPKRRTRAEIARNNGLEPLAKIIMSQHNDDIEDIAYRFLNKDIKDTDSAINGALDIIAEWISEKDSVSNVVRTSFRRSATLSCKVMNGKEAEAEKYQP